jgi:hypothetical protein
MARGGRLIRLTTVVAICAVCALFGAPDLAHVLGHDHHDGDDDHGEPCGICLALAQTLHVADAPCVVDLTPSPVGELQTSEPACSSRDLAWSPAAPRAPPPALSWS